MATFQERLKIGNTAEDIIINLLKVKYNDTLKERQNKENRHIMKYDILTENKRKIEVKRDLQFIKTGNIFIETVNKMNEPSGLSISKAREYFFILDSMIYSIKLKQLKNIINNNKLRYVRPSPKNGGGYILNFNEFKEVFIFEGVLNQYEII